MSLGAWLFAFALWGAGCAPLTRELPPGVPDRATLMSWERIRGDVATATEHVVYEFNVNPKYRALYQVTQYRVTRTGNAGSTKNGVETEKLIYHAHPGQRDSVECYERVSGQRDWRRLWLARESRWERLDPGSAAFRAEMMTAMGVYNLHRAASREREEER